MRGRPPKPTELKRRLGNPGKRRLPPAPVNEYLDLIAELTRNARAGRLDADEIAALERIAASDYDPALSPARARQLLAWQREGGGSRPPGDPPPRALPSSSGEKARD